MGKVTILMGKKERSFASLVRVSLEKLVRAYHFYRYLEQSLELSFVRETEREALFHEP